MILGIKINNNKIFFIFLLNYNKFTDKHSDYDCGIVKVKSKNIVDISTSKILYGSTWKRSAKNTAWCLLGCAIGDFGTILFFQLTKIPFPILYIMILAIINGLITSIILETLILMKQNISFLKSLKTAIGMSFISMLSMEIAMNTTDYVLTGGAILNWWIVPIMLIVGFLTPWPYNYWRLKKFNQACH